MARVRVIGCGNPDTGDDAAGLLAVAEARRALEAVPGVEVIPRASPLQLVHLLRDVAAVVVVDAIRTPGGGRVPGALIRAEAGPAGLPAGISSCLSSHGLGIAEAVGLTAALWPAPRVVVLGVEAESAVAGAPLSAAVRAVLPELVSRIVIEARGLAGQVERSASDGSTGTTSTGDSITR